MNLLRRKSKQIFIILLSLIVCTALAGIRPLKVSADSGSAAAPVYTGHNSWSQLTTSNGLAAAIYSAAQGKLIRFQRHIYSHVDANSTTPNFMWDSYFGYGIDGGKATWLNNVAVDSAKYVNGTNIINAVQNDNGLQFDSYYFTPFSGKNQHQSSLLVLLMKVTNNSGTDKKVSVFSSENLHLGTDYGTTDEQTAYNANNDYLKEFNGKNGSIAIYKNLNLSNEHHETGISGSGTGNNPWYDAANNGKLDDHVVSEGNDISAGFENRTNELAAGQSKWYGVIIGLNEDRNESNLSDDVLSLANTALSSPEALLTQEKDWWANWHSKEKMPAGLSEQEQQVYRQSTAVLKMSQSRESGSSYGQVLASLIPGEWSIAWARDGNYSIQALIESGHYQEARDALKFMFDAKMRQAEDGSGENYYQKNFIESTDTSPPTYGLGVHLSSNYLISVCRYFGNGTEESDWNNNGPNIEFDGWGLFLWSVDQYVRATGDTGFLADNNKNYWNKLTKQDADLLIELIDPANGLIQPDSSIWEEHWTPFNVLGTAPSRQQFAYTDITAYQGLKSAADLAKLMGDERSENKYSDAAASIKDAVLNHLVVHSDGYRTIASSLERKNDPSHYNDGSTVEAINFGLVNPRSNLASGMIQAFNQNLHITTGSTPGFKRDQDGDLYDSREWGFIDLRIAGALSKMGRDGEAKTLLDWMTSQASANYNLIPELLDYNTQDYAGSVPMGGFGSGSYILGINDYYNQQKSGNERQQ
ncbi:glycoside hydrolase family 15 protein [Sporolactobacillus pectinivorans]|uniref:glycoside hydrolase family 15 protein n=1 Tax=Sporolactobacillus pectinivorans TaxID=1591408 RepID=UPI000C25E899|nr:glycoside hydrolase family 15 protein [Sporolactobacillus pectinivorans]